MGKSTKGAKGAYGGGRRRRVGGSAASGDGDQSSGLSVNFVEVVRRPKREILKFLDDIDLFDELHLEEREVIAEMVDIVRCPGGTVLFEAGDEALYLYMIIQGEMELRTRDRPGIQHTFRSIEPGQCAGLDATLGRSDYCMQCVARDKTAALRFRLADLYQALESGQTGVIKLFAALGLQIGQQIRRAVSDVVFLLERTSVMPGKSDAVYDDDKMKSILGS